MGTYCKYLLTACLVCAKCHLPLLKMDKCQYSLTKGEEGRFSSHWVQNIRRGLATLDNIHVPPRAWHSLCDYRSSWVDVSSASREQQGDQQLGRSLPAVMLEVHRTKDHHAHSFLLSNRRTARQDQAGCPWSPSGAFSNQIFPEARAYLFAPGNAAL